MHIQDKEIRKIVSDDKEYRFGRYFDIKDILERMTISFDENQGSYRINARTVDGNERYTISMKADSEGQIIQNNCSCSYKNGCRHIAAILLFLRKLTITSYPYFYEKNQEDQRLLKQKEIELQRTQRILDKKQQESMSFIELYKDQLLRESLIPLSSKQYQLKTSIERKKDTLLLSVKILNEGYGYAIRNFESFIQAIENHQSIKYSKNFEFIHSEDAFDDDSLEILYFIKKCFLKNQLIQTGIMRNLIISDEQIDEFYQLMNTLPSMYSSNGYDKKEYRIPLEINLKNDNYILDFKEYQNFESMLMTSTSIFDFQNDILYYYQFHQPHKALLFIKKLLESRGGLYIPESALLDFYKYVLFDLSDDIEMETQLFDEYVQENMINLYADMTTDDQICIQLEYIYDESIQYGFNEENQHKSKEADLIENYLTPYIEDIDGDMVYLLFDHDFVYQFMKEGLPYLSHYCQVYVSDALKSFSVTQPMQLQVGVSVSHGLLEVNIDSIDVQRDELYDILKAYKKKRKFYKLKNGKVIALENKELRELDELTSSLQLKSQDLVNGHIEVPTYRLFELEQMMNKDSKIVYSKNQEFEKWCEDFVKPDHEYDVPTTYAKILRDYQIEGYQWLRLMQHYGFGGILADDMGLGKTLQMIAYLESMKSQGVHMVITPASLLLNWQDEIEKFSSCMKVICIYGQKQERDVLIENINDYDVVITSYDYIRRDIELYETKEFHTIVLDEAQYIKNPKTRNALSVKRLKAKQRFALTGTPIENSLAELWSIFDFLMPYYLYHYSYFLDKFERPIVKEQDENKQAMLKQMIEPFVLRRNKKDVLKELPDKIEQTLYLRFDEEEEKRYLASLVQVNKSLQEKLNINQLGRIDVLAMLTRLRQLCQDSRLIYDDVETPSSKLVGCMELIHNLKDNHKKILLFSSFTSVLELIQEQCIKEHVSYCRLDGSTPKTKRKQLVDQFQKDDTTLFLISLKAGGSGLNLTAAQAVIHFDPWWNMSAKNQATDRAHRIGQTESVQVFSLIMKNTIEEKIMNLQKQKKNLADSFVEGNEGTISSMNMEDMKALFEIGEN
ncbi:MAG: DEAD/DEAH box helicase [Coprobacillus sp.]